MQNNYKELLLSKYDSSPKGWKRWLSAKKNEYLRDALYGEYPNLSSLPEMLFWLKRDMVDYPRCPTCGAPIKSFGSRGYPSHCSCRCTQLDPSVREKNKNTNLSRYGVENGAQSYQAQEKMRQSCMEKYGVPNAFQSKEIQEKIKMKNIEKYGYDNPSKSPVIQRQRKQTLLDRYGVTIGFAVNSDYKRSKGESELYDFIFNKYPDAISNDREQIFPLELDIFIPSLNVGIEYDGDYWHSLPNMKKRDVLKNNACAHKNIHLIRVSEHDWINDNEITINRIIEEIDSYERY